MVGPEGPDSPVKLAPQGGGSSSYHAFMIESSMQILVRLGLVSKDRLGL